VSLTLPFARCRHLLTRRPESAPLNGDRAAEPHRDRQEALHCLNVKEASMLFPVLTTMILFDSYHPFVCWRAGAYEVTIWTRQRPGSMQPHLPTENGLRHWRHSQQRPPRLILICWILM
jgi:hypothetical protein